MSELGFDSLSLAVSVIAVFIAGIIRSYSGFGFALVVVTSMSLVLPPAQVVPVVFILEVFLGLRLVPQVWKNIDWYSLRWLLAGSFAATPVGVYLLVAVSPTVMRMTISGLVFVAAILLMRGWAWQRMPGTLFIVTTGVASGLLNGAAAIGGPPVILFYFSSPAGVAVSRASIIAFFMGIDVMGLVTSSIQGLITARTLLLALICLVPLFLGITLGSRLFVKLDQKSYRHHVLILLMILAAAGMVRSVFF